VLCQKYTPTDCFLGDFAHWEIHHNGIFLAMREERRSAVNSLTCETSITLALNLRAKLGWKRPLGS